MAEPRVPTVSRRVGEGVGNLLLATALAALVMVAALLRLGILQAQSAWLDEGYSISVARLPLTHVVDALRSTDTHPALYYAALHLWLDLAGFGVAQARLLSAMCGIATVPVLYLLAQELFDRATGLCAALLLAISPVAIWYSDDARVYAMTGLLAVAALFFLVRATRTNQWELWAAYAFMGALAFYADYSSAYILVAGGMFSLVVSRGHPRFRRWLVSHCAMVILLLPSLFLLTRQLGHLSLISWIPAPTPDTVGATLIDFISLNTPTPAVVSLVGLGMTALGALALFEDWSRGAYRRSHIFIACVVLMPLGLSLLVSQVQPVFLTRTVLVALYGILIFLARGAASLLHRHWRYTPAAASAALVPLMILNGASVHVAATTTITEDWRSATRYMAARAAAGDLMIFDPYYGQVPFDVYWEQYGIPMVGRGYPHDYELVDPSRRPMSTSGDIASAAKRAHTVWIVVRQGPDVERFTPAMSVWLTRKASFAGTREFTGVTVLRYVLKS